MGSLISCYAYVLRTVEDLSLYLTCTALVCCIVITITLVLGLGIGLGYNYCVVNMLVPNRYIPNLEERGPRKSLNPPYVLRSKDKSEMFEEILEAERYYDRDSQKHLYQFHSSLEATTVLDNTKLIIEDNKHPARFTIKSGIVPTTDEYDNNDEELQEKSTLETAVITNITKLDTDESKYPTHVTIKSVMTTNTATEYDDNDEVSQEKSMSDVAVITNNTRLDIQDRKHPTRTTLKTLMTRTTEEFDITDEISPITLTVDATTITNKMTLDLEDNTGLTPLTGINRDAKRELIFHDIGIIGINNSEPDPDSILVKDIDSEKEIPISPLALLRFLAKMRAENKNYTIKIIPT